MKSYNNVSLRGCSTMRLAATGAELHEPESPAELRTLALGMALRNRRCHWLGAGSNVVFAERVQTPVVSLMHVDKGLEHLGGGRFRAGCSVRIQKLIRFAQQQGFGGIEYLFSLPASVGGCVFMNAGRGHGTGDCIATVLEEVEIMDTTTGDIRREPANSEAFGYRISPYQSGKCVILGATIRLHPQTAEATEEKIRGRLESSRKHLDAGWPCCGSVFRCGNRWLFRAFRLAHPRCGGLAFSSKTSNWISNLGDGTLSDFKVLVGKMQTAHRMLGQKCELEIRMFE